MKTSYRDRVFYAAHDAIREAKEMVDLMDGDYGIWHEALRVAIELAAVKYNVTEKMVRARIEVV